MRICYLCDEYPPHPSGGIGAVVQQLARFMAARGHQVHVIGTYRDTKTISDEIDQGVHIRRIPRPTWVPKAKLTDLVTQWNLRTQVLHLINNTYLYILIN